MNNNNSTCRHSKSNEARNAAHSLVIKAALTFEANLMSLIVLPSIQHTVTCISIYLFVICKNVYRLFIVRHARGEVLPYSVQESWAVHMPLIQSIIPHFVSILISYNQTFQIIRLSSFVIINERGHPPVYFNKYSETYTIGI